MKIIKYDINNPSAESNILRMKAKAVKSVNDGYVKLCIADLNLTLDDLINKYGCVRGIGLSANQLGYGLAISVLHIKDKRIVIINPEIESIGKETQLFRMGCFSLYDYRGLVNYADSIKIRYTDEFGKPNENEFFGDNAAVVQHELDHLNGVLIFDRLPEKQKDLFIPIDKSQKKFQIKNMGIMHEAKRLLGQNKSISIEKYYSELFRHSCNYESYVKNAYEKRKELADIIAKYANKGDNILEAGCGTSALSVHLSRQGFNVTCIDANDNMLHLAERINKSNNGKVAYRKADITSTGFEDKSFDIIFSHGVLEHFSDQGISAALSEGFRISDTYIISVPTIWDKSGCLTGDERLMTVRSWQRIIKKSGLQIAETQSFYPKNIKPGNWWQKIWPAGNAVFVLTR